MNTFLLLLFFAPPHGYTPHGILPYVLRTSNMPFPGGGLGDERCGEGIGAVGGHLVWSIAVAVTSPCTPAQRVGLHVQTATRPP